MNHIGKATLYIRGAISMLKVEVRNVSSLTRPYAQYRSAVSVRWTPKGKRNERSTVETTFASILVLDGWGHPEPMGMWDESKTVTHENGITTGRARYSSCDPKCQSDFDTMIADHITKTGAKVLLDLRGHNPHREMSEAEQAEWERVGDKSIRHYAA